MLIEEVATKKKLLGECLQGYCRERKRAADSAWEDQDSCDNADGGEGVPIRCFRVQVERGFLNLKACRTGETGEDCAQCRTRIDQGANGLRADLEFDAQIRSGSD